MQADMQVTEARSASLTATSYLCVNVSQLSDPRAHALSTSQPEQGSRKGKGHGHGGGKKEEQVYIYTWLWSCVSIALFAFLHVC
jgi:hypothetical protein